MAAKIIKLSCRADYFPFFLSW